MTRHKTLLSTVVFTLALGVWPSIQLTAAEKIRPFRIPPADLKEQIIWGSTCDGPDGMAIAFGGQDQLSDEIPRTRIKVDGQWKSLSPQLREKNLLKAEHKLCSEMARQAKAIAATRRRAYFSARADETLVTEITKSERQLLDQHATLVKKLTQQSELGDLDVRARCATTLQLLQEYSTVAAAAVRLKSEDRFSPAAIRRDAQSLELLERTAEALDAEPAPRYLSPLVYDEHTNRFVLFGGDHGDYLTADTWLYNPASKTWRQSDSDASPQPRGGHTLVANGDGTVTLSGGYTYTSSTDYCGAQYQAIDDGNWTYDIVADVWKGTEQPAAHPARVYRTGPFHPDFFLQDPKPDAAAASRELESIPANRWVERQPPQQPELMRTWGHAVLDPDRDQILVFGGGHSAHCGSDVLHYHLATNRWELTAPVEFPLGQTYTNTEYPEGFNLNRRPWVTGHTYHGYNYDPASQRMYFVGRVHNTYVYDPALGDWTGRFPKPKPMVYGDCFYTLPVVSTPHGLICWTGRGGVFKLDAAAQEWREIVCDGAKLPGAEVDSSDFVYDSRRDRLIFFRNEYGKQYQGQVHVLDLKSGEVTQPAIGNTAALVALELKEISCGVYDPLNDLVLLAKVLPTKRGESPPTLAYDCANSRWVSLAIGFDTDREKRPAHPYGQGHSCGLLFDARRNVLWGVDTHERRVYALRLDISEADVEALKN